MPLEDILRSSKLIKNHILRTRRLMHENNKYRKFIAKNGLNPNDVISNELNAFTFLKFKVPDDGSQGSTASQSLIDTLKAEQKRSALLEAQLYVLQQDYHKALDKLKIPDENQSKLKG